jgi:ABC-2 type transport system permease protein
MLDSIRLYLRYLGISVRGQMQYRGSFVMSTIGHFLITGVEFIGILVLFDRFGSIRGWRLPEVALCYGIVNIAFSIADAMTRGFDMFGVMVKNGDFDRLLLRPRNTALQLAGQEFVLRRIGRFAQGLVVLLWSARVLGLAWSPAKVTLAVAATLGGACLFSGLFVLQATLAFWTVESLEIVNTVTYGGVETSQFPLSIYRPWFRRFFTGVIPLATISYFPALAILDRGSASGVPALLQWGAPAVGVVFLLLALQVWKIGIRHYCSTGS